MHEGHDHHHHTAPEKPGKAQAMLTYMLEHNRHHAEELHDISHVLEHEGHKEAADLIHDAVHDFQAGNDKLQKALACFEEA